MKAKTFGRAMVAVALTVAGCGDSEPAGPTPEQAAAAATIQAQGTARQAMREKVTALLATPGLVVAPAAGGAPSMAFKFDPTKRARAGKAYVAGAGELSVRPVLLDFDEGVTPPVVLCRLRDPATRPAGLSTLRQEEMKFVVTLANGQLTLRDAAGRTIRADAAAHQKLVADVLVAEAKRREPIDALHARLNAAATLVRDADAPDDGWPPRITFVRIANEDAYDLVVIPIASPGAVEKNPGGRYTASVVDGRAVLTRWDGKRRATLADDAAAIDFAAGDKTVRRSIAEVVSTERLAANVAAVNALLADVDVRPAVFCGTLVGPGEVSPIRFELTGKKNGYLTGTFMATSQGKSLPFTVRMTPSPVGVELEYSVDSADGRAGGASFGRGVRLLSLTIVNGEPTLTGRGMTLTAPSPAQAAAMRAAFDAHIAAGGRFKWGLSERPPEYVPRLLWLRSDGDQPLTGRAVYDNAAKDGIAGAAKTGDDFATLDLMLDTPPRAKEPVPLQLWVLPYGNSFVLAGYQRTPSPQSTSYVYYTPTAP